MVATSSASRYVFAVDLGTSGAKVALIDLDGRVAGWESEPVELLVLPGGGAEQRPDDWWQALVAAPLSNCILWTDMRGAPHLRRQFGGLLNLQGISLPRTCSTSALSIPRSTSAHRSSSTCSTT